MPAISIIVPVYNAAAYVRRCLDTLVNQTFRDIEILCCDDCSTDISAQFLKKYAAQDKRIQVLSTPENCGAGVARNICLDVAQGEYVCFVDADDCADLKMCERLLHWATTHDAELVHSQRRLRGEKEKGEPFLRNPRTGEAVPEGPAKKHPFLLFFPGWQPWGKLIKRQLIERHSIRFPELRVSEDMPFSFEVGLLAEPVVLTYESLYIYTRSRPGAHGNDRGPNRFDIFKSIDLAAAMFKRHGAYEQHSYPFRFTVQQYLLTFCYPRVATQWRKEFYEKLRTFLESLPPKHLTKEAQRFLAK